MEWMGGRGKKLATNLTHDGQNIGMKIVCLVIMHPVTTLLFVCRFRQKIAPCVLNYPPYSPDLVPCDFTSFPVLKMKLKECYFNDISTTQTASACGLGAIPKSELKQSFESLLNGCNKCIEAGRDYIELKTKINNNFLFLLISSCRPSLKKFFNAPYTFGTYKN